MATPGSNMSIVASFTDAWIETKERNIIKLRKEESHLLQMRGLKLFKDFVVATENYVASFTDAWIETKI